MKKFKLHDQLKSAGEEPGTLLVCQPMPGLSDSNILPCHVVLLSPENVVKYVEKDKQLIYAWEDNPQDDPKWKLMGTETYLNQEGFFKAVVVAYYTYIEVASNEESFLGDVLESLEAVS